MKERVSQIPDGNQNRESIINLAEIDDMNEGSLRKALKLVVQAGWGYGGMKGAELLKHAQMTKDEAYEALKLTALTLATNATEYREFVALATFWAEREKGKPSQSLEVTAKIGIVEIVLEAAKQRKLQLASDNLLLPPVDNTQAIDNE